MKLVYLSESADLSPYAMSAVLVDDEQWPKVYAASKQFRMGLKRDFSISPGDELRIPDLARSINDGEMPRFGRMVFSSYAQFLTSLPITVVGVVSKEGGDSVESLRKRAFPVLMHRIGRDSDFHGGYRFVVVCNQEIEKDIRAVSRRIRVYNPLPGVGNIPVSDLIEDSFVRDEKASHLLKSAELAAFLYRALYLFRSDKEEILLSQYDLLDREYVYRIFYVWSEKGILMERASLSNKYGMVTIR